jgi:hypothetical protein
MTTDGFGGVSSRSGAGPSLAPGSLDHLQLTRRGVVMKFSIDRTLDNSSLEAGVSVAERYHGCHRNICDEVFTAAECVDVVRNLQPQRLAPTLPIRLNGGASKISAQG